MEMIRINPALARLPLYLDNKRPIAYTEREREREGHCLKLICGTIPDIPI
jgi:DTW domain-containing protein YfiP